MGHQISDLKVLRGGLSCGCLQSRVCELGPTARWSRCVGKHCFTTLRSQNAICLSSCDDRHFWLFFWL